MLFPHRIASVQISNSAGHFEDPAVGTGRKTETVGDQFQQSAAGCVRFAELLYETGCHLGIAVDLGTLEAIPLDPAGTLHAATDLPGAFPLAAVGQIPILDGGNFDMDVDPVQQRPGDP